MSGEPQSVADSSLNFCVIVPTYNNAGTLPRVLDSILEYAADIIIVNDGSTDATSVILEEYSQLHQIRHERNCGKGMALRHGIEKARALGYDYAITIDSDGQHFPSDIPQFIAEISTHGSALVIGSRNMTQLGVPKKSSFGNNFSNFWFWVETRIRLTDTQSGFRLYPLAQVPKQYFTSKFEFEIEIIVRSAWKGISVKNIPIRISYDPNERVSHFRPFTDFFRISVLNTILVTLTLFYILPRDLVRKFKKKGFRKFIAENILANDDSNSKKALSIALGVFTGISPFWGFQSMIVLFLAVLFRLNKAIAFAFSNISFPPLIPFIIYASLKIGDFFFPAAAPFSAHSATFETLRSHAAQYLVGSFILATAASAVFGVIGYLMLAFIANKNKS